MSTPNPNPFAPRPARRPIAIEWLEICESTPVQFLPARKAFDLGEVIAEGPPNDFIRRNGKNSAPTNPLPPRGSSAFTILEMLIVVGIIGFLTAMALPHLGGMTRSNTMNAATRQVLDDINLARQRAIVNRSQVCMVFGPPPWFWSVFGTSNGVGGVYEASSVTNLFMHQYASYAIVALRSVGDQPGRPFVHYLTDWRYLPSGIFFSPEQLTNVIFTNWTGTANTLAGTSNYFGVTAFPTNLNSSAGVPFPSTYNPMYNLQLPFIQFTPTGALATNNDQFIMLTRGSIFYPMDVNGNPQFATTVDMVQTPPGNDTNNPNIIHIDCTTGRATIEKNQF